jgi:hypothetical protein
MFCLTLDNELTRIIIEREKTRGSVDVRTFLCFVLFRITWPGFLFLVLKRGLLRYSCNVFEMDNVTTRIFFIDVIGKRVSLFLGEIKRTTQNDNERDRLR